MSSDRHGHRQRRRSIRSVEEFEVTVNNSPPEVSANHSITDVDRRRLEDDSVDLSAYFSDADRGYADVCGGIVRHQRRDGFR